MWTSSPALLYSRTICFSVERASATHLVFLLLLLVAGKFLLRLLPSLRTVFSSPSWRRLALLYSQFSSGKERGLPL